MTSINPNDYESASYADPTGEEFSSGPRIECAGCGRWVKWCVCEDRYRKPVHSALVVCEEEGR